MRLLQGALAVHALSQLLGGGLGFGWFPEQVLGVPLDDAGRLGFRLAGFTNATTALVTFYLLLRGDLRVLRALAACALTYHALASAQALASVAAGGTLVAVGSSAGPFHVGTGLLLGVALVAAWRDRRSTNPRFNERLPPSASVASARRPSA